MKEKNRGISVQVNYYNPAHKAASERGAPDRLKKSLGLDVTKRIRFESLAFSVFDIST